MAEFAVGVLIVVGGLGILNAAMIITVAVSHWWWEQREEPHPKSYEQGRAYERYRLMNDSWWFSEHEPTMTLIQELTNPKLDIIDVRHNWRKRMVAKKENHQ